MMLHVSQTISVCIHTHREDATSAKVLEAKKAKEPIPKRQRSADEEDMFAAVASQAPAAAHHTTANNVAQVCHGRHTCKVKHTCNMCCVTKTTNAWCSVQDKALPPVNNTPIDSPISVHRPLHESQASSPVQEPTTASPSPVLHRASSPPAASVSPPHTSDAPQGMYHA